MRLTHVDAARITHGPRILASKLVSKGANNAGFCLLIRLLTTLSSTTYAFDSSMAWKKSSHTPA